MALVPPFSWCGIGNNPVLTARCDRAICGRYAISREVRMIEKKELTDLSKVDWTNLSPQEFAQMLAEKNDNRTEGDLAAEEAQSRFLVDRNLLPNN